MALIDRLRSVPPINSLDDLALALQFGGHRYPLTGNGTMPGSPMVEPDHNMGAYVAAVAGRSPVIAGAVAKRATVIQEARFRWRDSAGGPLDLLYTPDLDALHNPSMPLPQFLSTLEQHVSYAGNAYAARDLDGRFWILPPDRVSMTLGATGPSLFDPAARPQPIAYHLDRGEGQKPLTFTPDQIAHWAPIPDPRAPWRGCSWVTSLVRGHAVDQQVEQHLSNFYTNGATPNLVVAFDANLTDDQLRTYAELIRENHGGAANAYETLVLGGGADAKVVGSELDSLSYRDVRGGFENMVAVASQVPAVILQTREGQQGSALNAGNYQSTRRMWADTWVTPTLNSLCATLGQIVPSPRPGLELTFDPDLIQFLQEDRKDEAEIQMANAQAVRSLVEAGYDPASVVEAITSGDLTRLNHSGLYSVQLQAPGAADAEVEAARRLESAIRARLADRPDALPLLPSED